jgi:hypothetical protein
VPTIAVSPETATEKPKKSAKPPSLAVSLDCCVKLPLVLPRVKT